MPIHKMNFEGGVFYAKQVGYVDNVDARMWANALSNYAQKAAGQVTAIVDMTEVERFCPTVVKIFNDLAANVPNLVSVGLTTSDQMASRNAKIIDKLSGIPNIRFFSSMDAAHDHAVAQMRQPAYN